MSFVRTLVGWFLTAATILGSIALVGLMLVIGGTVIYRWFGGTFQGSYELAEIFTIVTITLAIVMATVQGQHVDVRLIFDRLPQLMRRSLTVILTLVSSGFWALVAYSAYRATRQLALKGEITHVLQINIVPFRWFITVGFLVVAIVLLVYAIRAISAEEKEVERSEYES